MWIPPQSTSSKKPLEVNQYGGDKSLKKRAYVKIEEWEPHKDFVLRQRHAKVKEKDILFALKHERGFNVEMHQLKKVLQLWNSKRNLKRKQRDYIVQIVKERRRAGKNQTIFYHPSGTLIDLPEVKEIMRRYGNSEPLEPPSPGGLIPGSPRLRQTPPDVLFNNREISPNYSDHISLTHSNTPPGSHGSVHSPIVETGLEYTTPPHLAIDLFLQQTTAQSASNITIPTTLGYSTDISPEAVYAPLGFAGELSMSSAYSNISRPIETPEIDPLLEYRLSRPAIPAMSGPSSMTTGYFPSLSSNEVYAPPPAPPVQYQPISETYSYPPPAPAAQKRPSRGRFPPPAPPAMQQATPAPPPAPPMPPQSKSKSFFSSLGNLGFLSSKKSSPPQVASGGSMDMAGAPMSAPYMPAPGGFARADQFAPPPQVQAPPPPPPPAPPIAPPGFSAGAPMPPPDAKYSQNEPEDLSRRRTSGRSSARTPRKEPFIKDEFAEISTLDYSKAKESKSSRYSEMADRAERVLSGMAPKENEATRWARQKAEADEEEAFRRRNEEMRLDRKRFEQHRLLALEQERIRLQQARMREEAEAESRRREFERAYIQPEQMEVDEDDAWSEEEETDKWNDSPEPNWKNEEQGSSDWGGEEEEDTWQQPAFSQRSVDFEQQRLQETYQRVSGKMYFYEPRMRLSKGVKVSDRYQILVGGEKKKFVSDGLDDTFKIKLEEITNDDLSDVVSAIEDLTVSEKEKKNDDKDLADALEGLKVSAGKRDGGEEEEEEEAWSDDEEKEDEWGEEDEKEDQWGEGAVQDRSGDIKDDNISSALDNLTLSDKPSTIDNDQNAAYDISAGVKISIEPTVCSKPKIIPSEVLRTTEFGDKEFHDIGFASDAMEQIYRIHLQNWLRDRVEWADWGLKVNRHPPKKSDGKKFLGENEKQLLPKHICRATKQLLKADMDPDAPEAEIQYEKKLWNWVLQRHKKIISYMKDTSDAYWITVWSKTEQAMVYFLPFLGRRFGSKHWFTLEAIKLLGESYLWENIEGGWKDGIQLKNLAYDGFVNLGFENAGIMSDCVDDGVIEREGGRGRRKMELRRAVEHYRIMRAEFGDWSQLGVYAIGLLIRKLAKVDKQRTRKLAPIAAAGLLKVPKGLKWREEIANAIWMVGEAMREVGMVKESVGFLWKTMPNMREIQNIKESLPSARVLGEIAEGLQLLGKSSQAIRWREVGLEVASHALRRGHPETTLWTNRAIRGLEARGVQFVNPPELTAIEWTAGRVFWEGQRRGANHKKLLKLTRKVIRKLGQGSR
ncbi:hypothetical protein TWF481_009708 [Arthrobotrys musiformis]|uniref:Clr5 domain-containing protein n=1 Tax=Arthrobotrys musiformis TaxID=47236 RepID=A0AAV9W5J3_9PEZI